MFPPQDAIKLSEKADAINRKAKGRKLLLTMTPPLHETCKIYLALTLNFSTEIYLQGLMKIKYFLLINHIIHMSFLYLQQK